MSEIQATSSASLVQLVRCRPEVFGPVYATPERLQWLKKFLLTGVLATRLNIAELLSVLSKEFQSDTVRKVCAHGVLYRSVFKTRS